MKNIGDLINTLQGTGTPGRPIEETILVCAGRSEGRRILQQCAAAGACLIGVTAESPMSLAMEVCSTMLSASDAPRLISDHEAAELILGLLLPENSSTEYFDSPAAKTPAVARELLKTFHELDMACSEPLTGSQKFVDTQTIRQLYAEKKNTDHLLDRIDLLKHACRIAEPNGRRYVALSSYAPSPLEKELLNKLSGGHLTIVPICAPKEIAPPANALSKEVALSGIPTDLSARSSFHPCRGKDTEVRFVFRDILKNSIPADDCAVIYLSGEYAQLIYETAARFHLPVDMSAGISLTGSGIYAMLSQLLTLPEENYNVENLCALIEAGICKPPHRYKLASALREQRVGWSKDRYLRFLEALAGDSKLSGYAGEWTAFFHDLFSVLEPSGTLSEQRRALLDFLRHYTNRTQHDEAAAYACAQKLIGEIASLRPDETALQRLVELMKSSNYLNAPAQPGHLFCAPLSQALCTGRKRLYILGMSRYALQGSDRESPILNDADRKQLGLKNAQSTEAENTFRLLQTVLQHEGEFVFCYPNFDSERMLDQKPASVYSDLRKAANAAETIITYIPDTALTAGDNMLQGIPAGTYTAQWNASETPALQSALSHRQQIDNFPFSCSSLETAFQCPRKFYLDKILHFRKPDIPEYSDSCWLPKNELGTFCHHVLEKYYQAVINQETPDLDALMQQECEDMEKRNPVSRKDLQDNDLQKARTIIENTIDWTTAEGRTVHSVERPFGRNVGGDPPPPSLPLTINSKKLLLSGSIDRVDEKDGKLRILDYKTGDVFRFTNDMSHHLQHYLYTLAEETLSNRKIEHADYLFLNTPTGIRLETIEEDNTKRSEMAQTVETLLEWLSDEEKCTNHIPCPVTVSGTTNAAIATEPNDPCRYCAYTEFCNKQ